MTNQLARMREKPSLRVIKGSIKYFRAIGRVVIEWVSLLNQIRRKRR
jgi:hypothetical protein